MNLPYTFKQDVVFVFLLVAATLLLISCNGQDEAVGVGETAVLQPTSEPTLEPTATAMPNPTATATPDPTATTTPEPTATAMPSPTATLPPFPEAQLGDNRGTVPANEADTWSYVGQVGELLFLNLAIETPNGDKPEETSLHPSIYVISPYGTHQELKIYNSALNPHPLSDVFISAGPLPKDGSYQVEVRGYESNEPSNYTLTIESKRVEVDISILEEYAGTYIEGPGLDVEMYVRGDQLFGKIRQWSVIYNLIPISDTTFFAIDGTITSFVRDEAGAVIGYQVWPFQEDVDKPYQAERVGEQP